MTRTSRISTIWPDHPAHRFAALAAVAGTGVDSARHLRTNVNEKGGALAVDAVYTNSPSLPCSLAAIDAIVVVANCAENRNTHGVRTYG